MWLKFPDNVNSVNVEQQTFSAEYENSSGRFFRVPDHFVSKLIALNMGFSVTSTPEGTDLDDLPPTQLTTSMSDLAAENARLQDENENLRNANKSLDQDNRSLKSQLETALGEIKRRDEVTKAPVSEKK